MRPMLVEDYQLLALLYNILYRRAARLSFKPVTP